MLHAIDLIILLPILVAVFVVGFVMFWLLTGYFFTQNATVDRLLVTLIIAVALVTGAAIISILLAGDDEEQAGTEPRQIREGGAIALYDTESTSTQYIVNDTVSDTLSCAELDAMIASNEWSLVTPTNLGAYQDMPRGEYRVLEGQRVLSFNLTDAQEQCRWFYDGSVRRSDTTIERLVAAEPTITIEDIVLGTGDIQFTLTWDNESDMDLWVYEPSGFRIWYGEPDSPTGGELDIDANLGCERVDPSVENVFWPTGQAPVGTYRVVVDEWGDCGTSVTNWVLVVKFGDEVILRETGTSARASFDIDYPGVQ